MKKCDNVRKHSDAVYFYMKALQKILCGKGKMTADVQCRNIPKFEHEAITSVDVERSMTQSRKVTKHQHFSRKRGLHFRCETVLYAQVEIGPCPKPDELYPHPHPCSLFIQGKVHVKLFLCLIKQHPMKKAHKGVKVKLHAFLNFT